MLDMGFMRADTAASFQSRKWSTDELGAGLEKILADGAVELPDDASQLQEFPWMGLLFVQDSDLYRINVSSPQWTN